MDQFASETNLFINAKKSFKTPIGGIMSIIQIITSVTITIIFIIDYIKKDEFTVKVYSEEFSNNIHDYYADFIISYPKIFLNTTRWVDYDLYQFFSNPFKECSDKDYKKFYEEKPKNETLIYYCLERHNPNKAYDFWYQLVRCSGLNTGPQYWQIRDPTCVDDPSPELEETFTGELIMKYYTFNETQIKNKTNKVEIETVEVDLKSYLWDYWRSDFRKTIVDDDYFFSNENTYYWTSVESLNRFEGYQNNLYQFELNHTNYLVKSMNIAKITNLLTTIFGLLEVINLFCYLITNFCSEFYYQKHVLNNFFDEKDYQNLFNKLYSAEELKTHQISKEKMLININDNIFTFFNCILYYLPFCRIGNDNLYYNKYKIIREGIMKQISMEKFIFPIQGTTLLNMHVNNENTKNVSGIIENEYERETVPFINSLDLFSNSRSFLINSDTKFYTRWSFIMTILYFTGSVIVVYFFGQNIWYSINPTINALDIKLTDALDKTDKHLNTLLKYSLSEDFARSTKFVKWNYPEGVFKKLDYWECREKDLILFNVTYPTNINIVHYCVELKSIFDNIFEDGAMTDAELHFANCTLLKHLNVRESECDYSGLKLGDDLYFRLDYYSYTYDLTKTKDYKIEKLNSIVHRPIYDMRDIFHFTLKLFAKNLKDDQDLFVKEKKEDYIFTTDKFQLHHLNLNGRGSLAATYLNFASRYVEINRTFEKIPGALAIIMTFCGIYYFILNLLYKSILEYFFIKHFKEEFIDHFNIINPETILKRRNEESNSQYPLNTYDITKIPANLGKQKNSVNEIINFKNYFLNNFCCCKKKNVLYSNFNEKIKEFLSIENYLFKKEIQYSETSCGLSCLDFNTQISTLFTVRNRRKYSTFLGGLLSILFLILLFPIFYVFGHNFWTKTNPVINSIQFAFSEINEKYEFHLNIPLIFGYSKSIDKDMKENIFSMVSKPPNVTYCTEEELKVLYTDEDIDKNMVYKCTNINKLVDEDIYHGTAILNNIYIMQHTCTYPENKCKVPEDVYKVGFALNYTFFNPDYYSDYFENNLIKVQMEKKMANFPYGAYYFSQNVLLNDNNIFTAGTTTEYFTSIMLRSLRNSGQWGPKEGCLEFRFLINDTLNVITRVYKKFPEMLIEVLSIIALVKFVIKSICSIYSDYSYEKYITYKLLHLIDLNNMGYVLPDSKVDCGEIVQTNCNYKIEIVQEIFTFTNFILGKYFNFICKCDKNVQKILFLRKKVFELTSLENLYKLLNVKQIIPDDIQRIDIVNTKFEMTNNIKV